MTITISPNTKALIFDCDGTLVHSLPVYYRAWKHSFDTRGHDFPYEFLMQRNGVKAHNVLHEFNMTYNANIDIDQFIIDTETMVYENLDQLQEITPIANLLREYSQRMPCIVLSGGSRKNVHRCLQITGLDQYAHQVFTADDDLPAKDAPELYHQISKHLGHPPEACHFFEDGEFSIAAARSTGMYVTEINEGLLKQLNDA